MWQTEEDSEARRRGRARPRPGLVVVFSGSAPTLQAHPIDGDGVVLGRELLERRSREDQDDQGAREARERRSREDQDDQGAREARDPLTDDRISRQHARVRAAQGGVAIHDLGSRNGTYIAGERIDGEVWVQAPAVIRAGRTIALVVDDVARFLGGRIDERGESLGPVVGPTLAEAWRRVELAARTGDNLLVTGESGTGKELAARAYHAATGATGELVSVNCAAIPAGVAERLLFGTRRGAYSGADRDADGYLVAADGGTIFLDEIGELELAVQAKLLRVLETREVLPLGAARPRKIDLRVVAATLRDLRDEVAERRFREDLYHRVGRPEVHLMALRERLEDVPRLIARTAASAAPGMPLQPALVEACMLRRWPGNARELIGEIRRAALAARDAGGGELGVDDLDPMAGLVIERRTPPPSALAARATPAPLPDRDTIVRSLLAEGGNVARTARQLGLHRNQLRRFLARHPDLAPSCGDELSEHSEPR
jgi:transcriptional regulator of acetoin/glycerol metabolism